jgi:hypothetical protein
MRNSSTVRHREILLNGGRAYIRDTVYDDPFKLKIKAWLISFQQITFRQMSEIRGAKSYMNPGEVLSARAGNHIQLLPGSRMSILSCSAWKCSGMSAECCSLGYLFLVNLIAREQSRCSSGMKRQLWVWYCTTCWSDINKQCTVEEYARNTSLIPFYCKLHNSYIYQIKTISRPSKSREIIPWNVTKKWRIFFKSGLVE